MEEQNQNTDPAKMEVIFELKFVTNRSTKEIVMQTIGEQKSNLEKLVLAALLNHFSNEISQSITAKGEHETFDEALVALLNERKK